MTDPRSPLFNFSVGIVSGILMGMLIGNAVTMHTVTARVERRNAEVAEQHRATIERLTADAQTKLIAESLALKDCEALYTEMIEHAARAAQTAEIDKFQSDFRDRWYTLVYEPQPEFAPTPQGQALAQVLNVYRPGLGTMLVKLQTPPQPGMQLRMVLHGYVKAEALPAGAHLVYTLTPPESQVQ
jgi:hypothetical protein